MIRKRIFTFCVAAVCAFLTAGCSTAALPGETVNAEEAVQGTARNRLEAVQELGKLVIGISADYAPFAFELSKEGEDGLLYAGSDIELGKYIAGQLGVEAEFLEMPFEDCMDAAENGSVDLVLLGMLPRTERSLRMDFTDVYYEPGRQVLLIKENQTDKLNTLENLAGKTIAAQYGTLQAQLVVEQLPESYLELTDNVSKAVLMLRMGTADAVALDEATAQDLISEYSGLAVMKEAFSYTPEGVVGGVEKGQTELLEQINEAIKSASDSHLYLEWLDKATEQAKEISVR